VFIDPTDIFLIWDPRYGRHQRERADSGEMTFVEAVFSFVFGDGNPNENFEVGASWTIRQWTASRLILALSTTCDWLLSSQRAARMMCRALAACICMVAIQQKGRLLAAAHAVG
jgi:hypothetical protein